jgi:hypothetical protein
MRSIRSILPWPVLVLAFAMAASAASPDTLALSDPTAKLSIWEGRWNLNITRYETPYSHAGAGSGTANCNWMPNKGYMICDYLTDRSDSGGAINNLSVFSYSPSEGAYTHLGISKDAKPLWERVTIEGNTWITPLELPYKGKTIQYRDVYVFLSSGKQVIRNEVSADNGKSWTLLSQALAIKQS